MAMVCRRELGMGDWGGVGEIAHQHESRGDDERFVADMTYPPRSPRAEEWASKQLALGYSFRSV
jgi:hypothetical protein